MMTNQKGFTLVESMMVVGLTAMVAGALFVAMKYGDQNMETADIKMTIQDSARDGLYKMTQELRMTSPTRVTIAADCSNIQFNIPDPNSPTSATTYAVNWPGHVIQYALNTSKQLVRTNVTLGTTSILANDATGLMFTTDTTSPFACVAGASPTVITAIISVQRALKNGRLEPAVALSVAGQARIRNTG